MERYWAIKELLLIMGTNNLKEAEFEFYFLTGNVSILQLN